MLYILYYTETGNTEKVALKLKEKLSGAVVVNINNFDSNVLKGEDTLILGCAAYGDEELSLEMETFIDNINYELNGKTLGLFGSYGSGDESWMDKWIKKIEGLGAKVIDNGLRVQRDSIEEAFYDKYANFFKKQKISL
ncbi:flavodoxin domain-containing protein [Fusobacteria bacterium ZRK30]|nr:flavodoxin domain-containing protein [Fusobacteria bacterium ZRK30]